jgi:hypothetical protein
MVRPDKIRHHEASLTELRKQLIRTLGVDAVDLVMKRAIFELCNTHPSMSLIRCEDDELSFDALDPAFAHASDEEVDAAFEALNGVMLLVIARILGREIAARLARGFASPQVMKGIDREQA